MLTRRNVLALTTLPLLAGSTCLTAVAAEKEVLIGVLYPFTGSGAQIGVEAKMAIDVAVDVINNVYDLDLPLAREAGLPKLGGAKVRVIYADHQADPQKGRSEAERLITQNKVSALLGTYHSAVANVVSQVAQRYEVPFMAAESSSPSLHRQGLSYFFRPGPHDEMFSVAMFDFLDDLRKKKPDSIKTVGFFYEDTLFGNDSSRIQKKLAEERGYKIVVDVKYRANSPSLNTEVGLLKAADPDVLLTTCYTTDAILFVNTADSLGYKPKNIVAQNAGFQEPSFLNTVGKKADGIISRSSFVPDLASKRPSLKLVNELFRKQSGKDLNDSTARELMAMLVLADAINRAGNTKGADIAAALRTTDIPGEKTILPWDRVMFDARGQNVTVKPVMMQFGDGEYRTVWPDRLATRPLKWPMN